MKKLLVALSILTTGLILTITANYFNNNPLKVEADVGSYTTDVNTYYDDITATSGKQLLAQVHDLITSTHQTYPTYNDSGANGYQKYTDQYYEGDTKIDGYLYEFYTGEKWDNTWYYGGEYGSSGKTGCYNREHVWPKSLSNGLWNSSSPTLGGADMHHIRPAEKDLNSTRNNAKYGLVSDRENEKAYAKNSSGVLTYHGGYGDSNLFEPLDNKKGDVARIILYLYTHYNTKTSSIFGGFATNDGEGSGTLPLTNVIDANSEEAAIDLLLSWHTSDPVDKIETRRNEQIAIYQGNRNPFIDCPEYVEAIWGDTPLEEDKVINVTSVSLNETLLNLNIGDESTLVATVLPIDATNKTLTWSSSNNNVATVDENGLVVAKGSGSATITVETVDGNKTDTCDVIVDEEEIVVPPTPSGDEQFVKITKEADFTDGQYLIVYETGNVAFNGGLETLDAVSNTISVEISNGIIEANEDTKGAIFTIDKDDKTIISSSGQYINRSIDSNGMDASSTLSDSYKHNSLEIDADGNFVVNASGGGYLRYNSASNQLRFRYYKSGSYTGQKAIQLYKLVDPDYQKVQEFVDTYMHMNDATGDGNGYCKSKGWYSLAKDAFNKLTKEQRIILATDFSDAFDRLEAWAIANEETIIYQNGDYIVSNFNNRLQIFENNDISLINIISIVSIGIIVLIFVVILKKRQRE